MKKKYLAALLVLGVYGTSYSAAQAVKRRMSYDAGSMRVDLQDVSLDGDWEFMCDADQTPQTLEPKNQQDRKIASAAQSKLPAIKFSAGPQIDASIEQQFGALFCKEVQLGALLGDKDLDPLDAGNIIASALTHYSQQGNQELDKKGRLRMACLAEQEVFELIFANHAVALSVIKKAKLHQVLCLKNPDFAKIEFSDSEDDSRTSSAPSNAHSESDTDKPARHSPATIRPVGSAAMLETLSKEEMRPPRRFTLRRLVKRLLRRGDESSSDSSDDEQ